MSCKETMKTKQSINDVLHSNMAFVCENYNLSMHIYAKFYKTLTTSVSYEDLLSYWNEGYMKACVEWFTKEQLRTQYAFGTIIYTCGSTKCWAYLASIHRQKRLADITSISIDAPCIQKRPTHACKQEYVLSDVLPCKVCLEKDVLNSEYARLLQNCLEHFCMSKYSDKRNIVMYHLMNDMELYRLRKYFDGSVQAIYSMATRMRDSIQNTFPNLYSSLHTNEIPKALMQYYKPVKTLDNKTRQQIIISLRGGEKPKDVAQQYNVLFSHVYDTVLSAGLEEIVCANC